MTVVEYMLKNILFVVLILIGAVGAYFAFNSADRIKPIVAADKSEPIVVGQEAEPSIDQGLSQSKDGIEIAIDKIEQSEETTKITLALNNHRYDLAEPSIYEQATLNDQPALEYTMLSDAVGGHHVEAEVVFPRNKTGVLVIAPTPSAVFTFDDLWE